MSTELTVQNRQGSLCMAQTDMRQKKLLLSIIFITMHWFGLESSSLAAICSTNTTVCHKTNIGDVLAMQAWSTVRAKGKSIPSGGTLVIGREQDCPGGCFDSHPGAAGQTQRRYQLQA